MLTQVSSHALSSPPAHVSQMPSVAANCSKALDTDIKSSVAGFERHASCTNHQWHIRVNVCLPWLQMWHLEKSLHWIWDKKKYHKEVTQQPSLGITQISVSFSSLTHPILTKKMWLSVMLWNSLTSEKEKASLDVLTVWSNPHLE